MTRTARFASSPLGRPLFAPVAFATFISRADRVLNPQFRASNEQALRPDGRLRRVCSVRDAAIWFSRPNRRVALRPISVRSLKKEGAERSARFARPHQRAINSFAGRSGGLVCHQVVGGTSMQRNRFVALAALLLLASCGQASKRRRAKPGWSPHRRPPPTPPLACGYRRCLPGNWRGSITRKTVRLHAAGAEPRRGMAAFNAPTRCGAARMHLLQLAISAAATPMQHPPSSAIARDKHRWTSHVARRASATPAKWWAICRTKPVEVPAVGRPLHARRTGQRRLRDHTAIANLTEVTYAWHHA